MGASQSTILELGLDSSPVGSPFTASAASVKSETRTTPSLTDFQSRPIKGEATDPPLFRSPSYSPQSSGSLKRKSSSPGVQSNASSDYAAKRIKHESPEPRGLGLSIPHCQSHSRKPRTTNEWNSLPSNEWTPIPINDRLLIPSNDMKYIVPTYWTPASNNTLTPVPSNGWKPLPSNGSHRMLYC